MNLIQAVLGAIVFFAIYAAPNVRASKPPAKQKAEGLGDGYPPHRVNDTLRVDLKREDFKYANWSHPMECPLAIATKKAAKVPYVMVSPYMVSMPCRRDTADFYWIHDGYWLEQFREDSIKALRPGSGVIRTVILIREPIKSRGV